MTRFSTAFRVPKHNLGLLLEYLYLGGVRPRSRHPAIRCLWAFHWINGDANLRECGFDLVAPGRRSGQLLLHEQSVTPFFLANAYRLGVLHKVLFLVRARPRCAARRLFLILGRHREAFLFFV